MRSTVNAVFCDFDGTIARRDVGYNLFRHFSGGKNEELLPDWKAGRLSTRRCLELEAQMVRATANDIYRFLDGFDLSGGFVEFEATCRANGIDVIVVSDGLDFYIRYILARYRFEHLPVIANRGKAEAGGLTVDFVHENRFCTRCGSCKGERIREYRDQQSGLSRIVFVGDGYSDACATGEADIVFAKKDLERYCLDNNIPYLGYDDFFDVARELRALGLIGVSDQ